MRTAGRTDALLIAATISLLVALPCRAQVVAPPVEKRAVEIGLAYKWFHRDVTSGQVAEADWEVATGYARYGAWNRITLSAEGGLWEVGSDDRQFSRWTIGAGVSARVYTRGPWRVLVTGTFNEVYDLDESDLHSDERTRSWTAALLADHTFAWGEYHLDLWAGPMLVDDLAEVYAFNSPEPVDLEMDLTMGLALGAYGVAFDRFSGFAYIVYAEHSQFRFGVSIRPRGDEP